MREASAFVIRRTYGAVVTVGCAVVVVVVAAESGDTLGDGESLLLLLAFPDVASIASVL